MSKERPAWMTPVIYSNDRFVPPPQQPNAGPSRSQEDADTKDGSDVEEILRRPDRRQNREYECNDTTPLD